MKGDALCPSLTHAGRRLEILHALHGARRCCDEADAAAARGLSRPQQLQVSRSLARASARAAWPLPARLARLLSPGRRAVPGSPPRSEFEALLVTAAEAVHRLSPHPAALGVAVELLDVVTALARTDAAGDRAERLPAS